MDSCVVVYSVHTVPDTLQTQVHTKDSSVLHKLRVRCIGRVWLCNHIKAFGPAPFLHQGKKVLKAYWANIPKYAGENTELAWPYRIKCTTVIP